jgi:hypothetical protein
MDNPSQRFFTIEEANEILAIIRPLMREALEIRQKILAAQAEIWPVIEKVLGNGGNLQASRAVKDFDRLNSIVHQMQDLGVIIKDLNTGLVDFLAVRKGRDIYLCWKFDEPQVEYWHDIDAGFAGRQPWE